VKQRSVLSIVKRRDLRRELNLNSICREFHLSSERMEFKLWNEFSEIVFALNRENKMHIEASFVSFISMSLTKLQ
jgi:hypothetical protein